ncbi:MAG: hypothetical protein JST45_11855 [Bacteroidetes bacterium]|nr:hypothetical protein [Bacteroidota bacterium]
MMVPQVASYQAHGWAFGSAQANLSFSTSGIDEFDLSGAEGQNNPGKEAT